MQEEYRWCPDVPGPCGTVARFIWLAEQLVSDWLKGPNTCPAVGMLVAEDLDELTARIARALCDIAIETTEIALRKLRKET